MFQLTITRHRQTPQTATYLTVEALHAELESLGVPRRYWRLGSYTYGERYDWSEIPTRAHRRCGGTGSIIPASGVPTTCMGCSGTGRIAVPTAAQRVEIERTARRHTDALAKIKACAVSYADRVDNVEYLASSGMDHLAIREPHRMDALYASVESGRVVDVVRALCAYRAAIG